MSAIFIIAGPPGVGKSTSGEDFISPELDILNEDEMRFKYKAKGFADYNEYSIYRVRDIIKTKLIRDEDFALELNLGFEHQYNYALSLKKFNTDNSLHVILFFTDDVQLCKDRARERHESGLHLVKPETIQQMYDNTIPLFKTNFDAIDHAQFVQADKSNSIIRVAEYDRATRSLIILNDNIGWFNNQLKDFLQERLQLKPDIKQTEPKKRPGGPRL